MSLQELTCEDMDEVPLIHFSFLQNGNNIGILSDLKGTVIAWLKRVSAEAKLLAVLFKSDSISIII